MKKNENDELLPDMISAALLDSIKPVQPNAIQAKSLRARVLDKIHASVTNEDDNTAIVIPKMKGKWIRMTPLIKFKILLNEGDTGSYYLKLKAGATLPPHDHPDAEECIILEGDIFMGDQHLFSGDYQITPKGKNHPNIHTENGALLYIRGTIPEAIRPLL